MKLTHHRNYVMENMERLSSAWTEDQNQHNVDKYSDHLGEGKKYAWGFKELTWWKYWNGFSASKRLFARFERCHNLHNIKLSGEAAMLIQSLLIIILKCWRKIIKEGGYTPQQMFNVKETGVHWKCMPDKTLISEEMSVPGFKAAKDQWILILGGNAKDNLKVKLLVVYYSENPRAMKVFTKPNLFVILSLNREA